MRIQYCFLMARTIGSLSWTFSNIEHSKSESLWPFLSFSLYINDIVTLQDESTKVSIYADNNNHLLKLEQDDLVNKARIELKMEEILIYMNSN